MASTIKVDNIQDQCGTAVISKCGSTHTVTAEVYKADTIKDTSDNTYLAKSGTTITLGASGDTVTLASGASQSGFGRSGSVDWDTTAKTTGFTAVSGNGYFVNTTSGAITVTLPATPSAGDIVAVKDYTGTFGTNVCTVARNGSNIRGAASDFELGKNNAGATFIYVDATEGWQVFIDGSDTDASPGFIVATGGTITECGDYRIHTFTGPGTFCVSCSGCAGNNKVDYTVVAGGGGSGSRIRSGGGGGGGYRESKCSTVSGCWTASPRATPTSLEVAVQGYPVTVGAGGANGGCACATIAGGPGSNSIFLTITSSGGGGSGAAQPSYCNPARTGLPGGSGGGAGSGGGTNFPGGAGNQPPVSPPQGTNGGTGIGGGNQTGAGGGGATASGTASPPCGTGSTPLAAPGGAGATNTITGSPVGRAGGGAGGAGPATTTRGSGSEGGGNAGLNGTTNTGGGAGGSNWPGGTPSAGFTGGSGVVIIRYKYQ